jgi:hypothetical protein
VAVPLLLFAARDRFKAAMADPENLVRIHRTLRQGAGRRTREIALDRAIVVFSVAAWQAFVQDSARAALDLMRPQGGSAQGSYQVLRALLLRSLGTFSTPNSENTRDLLLHVGYDPWPYWEWREGRYRLRSVDVRQRLNHWLQVRHAIAHGGKLPIVPMLRRTGAGSPTLRLANAKACMVFFDRLTEVTTNGLAKELTVT